MGVADPTETALGILSLIDEVRAKMDGTRLATVPGRPTDPEIADTLAELRQPFQRCSDVTEAVIVVAEAAAALAADERARSTKASSNS